MLELRSGRPLTLAPFLRQNIAATPLATWLAIGAYYKFPWTAATPIPTIIADYRVFLGL